MSEVHNRRVKRLPFLDREDERKQLRRLFRRPEGALAVLYGRRRCGKSRLLQEALPERRAVYFVGDDRESALQRAALAAEIARLNPGFDRVQYPDWDALLARLWAEAPPVSVVALDEFPSLVWAAPELPSLLQKPRRPPRAPSGRCPTIPAHAYRAAASPAAPFEQRQDLVGQRRIEIAPHREPSLSLPRRAQRPGRSLECNQSGARFSIAGQDDLLAVRRAFDQLGQMHLGLSDVDDGWGRSSWHAGRLPRLTKMVNAGCVRIARTSDG